MVDGGDNNRVRKRLVSEDGTLSVRGQPVPNMLGKVSNTVLRIESVSAVDDTEKGSNTPGKLPIVKRRKQGEVGSEEDMDLLNEAASEKEDRRSK